MANSKDVTAIVEQLQKLLKAAGSEGVSIGSPQVGQVTIDSETKSLKPVTIITKCRHPVTASELQDLSDVSELSDWDSLTIDKKGNLCLPRPVSEYSKKDADSISVNRAKQRLGERLSGKNPSVSSMSSTVLHDMQALLGSKNSAEFNEILGRVGKAPAATTA